MNSALKHVAERMVMVTVNSLVIHLVLRLFRHRISSGIARAPDVPFQSESEESNDPEPKRARVSDEVARLVRGTVDLTGDADSGSAPLPPRVSTEDKRPRPRPSPHSHATHIAKCLLHADAGGPFAESSDVLAQPRNVKTDSNVDT